MDSATKGVTWLYFWTYYPNRSVFAYTLGTQNVLR